MNSISRKLHDLEKNVISDTPKTKTVLYIEDSTEREIHKRAGEILTKQREIATELHDILKANPKAEVNIQALDLTSDEKTIVAKSNALYHHSHGTVRQWHSSVYPLKRSSIQVDFLQST